MQLTVFGASGRTGRHVVRQALGHGHDVVAFVRERGSLEERDSRLHEIEGDVLQPETVDPAVRGSLAVISAIGSRAGTQPPNVYSDGIHHIVQSMERFGASRLVCLSSVGVGQSRQRRSLFRLRKPAISPAMRDALEHMGRMEAEVMLSELDWTIVRPPRLVEGPLTGEYRTVEGGRVPKGTSISRADLASFMLKCAETDLFLRRAVAIAY